MINLVTKHISYFAERTFLKPWTMISTSGNDRKAQEKSLFPAEKCRKSTENGSNTPGRKIAELSGDFQAFLCGTVRGG